MVGFLFELIGATGPINNKNRLRHGYDNPMSAGFEARKRPQNKARIVLVLVVVLVLEKLWRVHVMCDRPPPGGEPLHVISTPYVEPHLEDEDDDEYDG